MGSTPTAGSKDMKRSARIGVPSYTYRQQKTEEKLIYRRLLLIGGMTIVLLIIVWFWGVTFIRIIGSLGSSINEGPEEPGITLPLFKPNLTNLPEYTNDAQITVSGTTSPDVKVTLTVNGAGVGETISDSSGSFSFVSVKLKEGLNLIKVTAVSNSGETLEERALITLDSKAPVLKVTTPTNNQSFPKDTKTIPVKGTSDPDATVFVNSIQTTLDRDGNFTYQFSPKAGQNKIEVSAKDKAGNTKTIKLTVIVED